MFFYQVLLVIVKGFINYHNKEIPFVIENEFMNFFASDKSSLYEFINKYRFQNNFILDGKICGSYFSSRVAKFLIESIIGEFCTLKAYCFFMQSDSGESYNKIGFQSPFLDDFFRYRYVLLTNAREGTNLLSSSKNIYNIPFKMNCQDYELVYRIGYNNELGLMEDYDRKGEAIFGLKGSDIEECYSLAITLHRLSIFMTSRSDVCFTKISLYNGITKVGEFYCPFVLRNAKSYDAISYFQFDVMKYIPNILNNIALDISNNLTKSIPLGHIGNNESTYSPQRFIEQVIAFEYLFDKLEPGRNNEYLIDKLKEMIEKFPKIIDVKTFNVDKISNDIKELRREITHGYTYYYDFKDDAYRQYLMNLLDKLIKNMSLLYIGFTPEEISDFNKT